MLVGLPEGSNLLKNQKDLQKLQEFSKTRLYFVDKIVESGLLSFTAVYIVSNREWQEYN